MATKKRPVTKSGTPRQRKGVKLKPTELGPQRARARPLRRRSSRSSRDAVEADGGAVLAAYREPLGGHALLFAALPLDEGRAHAVPARRLRRATCASSRWRWTRPSATSTPSSRCATATGYLTPNGNHRLTALKELGAKTRPGAARARARGRLPDPRPQHREGPQPAREGARGACACTATSPRSPATSEETELRARVRGAGARRRSASPTRSAAGSRAAPTSRSCKQGRRVPAGAARADALDERERRAEVLLAFDDAVAGAVARLKEKGFDSPYLKNFVVARVNPLRFIKGEPPPFDELFAQMTKRARGWTRGRSRARTWRGRGGAAGGRKRKGRGAGPGGVEAAVGGVPGSGVEGRPCPGGRALRAPGRGRWPCPCAGGRALRILRAW